MLHPADKLTEDEKIELVRDLSAEYATAKVAIPRSKKASRLTTPTGTYDHMAWHDGALTMGQAARLGDKVQITKVSLEGDHMVLELNGGLKSGGHWYDNVQVGMGGVGGPVGRGSSATQGTWILLNFHKPMENLTAAEVKKILAPVLDFDQRSATVLYSETLPPEVQKAISEKRALVGMDRDQVLLAMGHPDHKYREEVRTASNTEDWIFGTPLRENCFRNFQREQGCEGQGTIRGPGQSDRGPAGPLACISHTGFQSRGKGG